MMPQVVTSLWLLVTSLLLMTCARGEVEQTLVYSFVMVDYDWPNNTVRQEYITQKKYIVQNNIITGIKVYEGEVYLTVPRWLPGVPSTLNRVVTKQGDHAVLQPYPSWSYQSLGDCEALQYVQSMEVDPNTGLMWIIDTGRVDFFHSTTAPARNLCPPKLVIYDIKQDRHVHTHTFPSSVADPTSCFLNDIVLHYVDDDVKYAYITDTNDAKLYVYNHEEDTSHFFQHSSMLAEEQGGTPIDGIAMSADFNFVYFSPIAGKGLFQIPTFVLTNPNASFGQHVRRVGTRPSRSDGLTYGQRSLFYGLIDYSGVERWLVDHDAKYAGYANVSMSSRQTLVKDDVRMLWVDTFAWDDSGHLWFTANHLTNFFAHRMDVSGASGPNMYVWKVFVNETSYLYKSVLVSGAGETSRVVWPLGLAIVLWGFSGL